MVDNTDLEWGSLNDLMGVVRRWNLRTAGRPESTNIVDMRGQLSTSQKEAAARQEAYKTKYNEMVAYDTAHGTLAPSEQPMKLLGGASPSKDVIDTMIAEAGGNLKGLHAVAAVINNRTSQLGKTPDQVVKQSGQFEGYSNPGRASREAQKSPHIRALAEKAYNDIVSGAVPDPTNGGTQFRAASASGVLGKNVVNIGGNVFKLGNAPSSAVAAIDAVAPVPRSIPTSLSAYADTPAVALPPLPIPRPSNPEGIRSVEINPDGTLKQSLTDALAAKFGNSTARTGADTSIYNTVTGYTPAFQSPSPLAPFVSEDHPTSNAVSAPLTSRSVHTVQIDPLTGNPVTTPSLQDALTAKAAQMAQQRPQSVGQTSPITAPLPPLPAPKFTFGSTPSYEQYPTTSGSLRTTSAQAGNVALPPNVVPASVLRDLQTIAPRAMNSSGSPDDRQTAPVIKPASLPPLPAPIPMPSRPTSLSPNPLVQRNSNDVVRSVPYVPPTPAPSHYTDASNPLDIDRLGLTVGPPVSPAVQAIQQAAPATQKILNPAYTAALKAGQAYTATGNVVTQAQQNAFGGLTSVPIPPPIPVRTPAPSKYITVKVPGVTQPNVPLPRPRPATPTTNNGGLLGLLFPGTNQNAFSLMGNGISSLFGGGSSPAAPRNSAPVSMAPAPATARFLSDRGVDSSNMTIGQQMNALQKSLEGRD